MIKFGQYKVEEGAGEKLIELNRKTCELKTSPRAEARFLRICVRNNFPIKNR